MGNCCERCRILPGPRARAQIKRQGICTDEVSVLKIYLQKISRSKSLQFHEKKNRITKNLYKTEYVEKWEKPVIGPIKVFKKWTNLCAFFMVYCFFFAIQGLSLDPFFPYWMSSIHQKKRRKFFCITSLRDDDK